MVLPHYCAVRLKEMYLHFTAYIYFYINILLVFHECILQQYKKQYIIFFTRFSHTLIHFSLFPNTFFSLILDLIKLLCTPDFSIVTFTTELSTNLVYKSIFIIDYNYIFIHLLFFFTVKLSIFSKLCVKYKRVMSRSTHTEI